VSASRDERMPGSVPTSPGGGEPMRRRGSSDFSMVEPAQFSSYYGRNIVKPAPWEHDIAAYLFSGGLAAGSSLLAAGASVTGRDKLRRNSRLGALVAVAFSALALVHDLGKPSRFLNMLRTVKLTSPMSVGTWILSSYGPFAGLAAVGEMARMLPEPLTPRRLRTASRLAQWSAGPAGLVAGITAPPLAAYTAVLLSDTATPSWHESYRELPFVFCGSAAAASGGLAMLTSPVAEAGPARRFALGGALVELAMEQRMEQSMGITAEPLHQGRAGSYMKAAKILTAAGAAGTLLAGRSRTAAVLSGAALLAGSACTRFGVFEAGIESARDPKYTVVPQRERIEREGPTRYVGK
jgi:hypothetical protein